MINKFEAVGIAISIGAMALALFLIRVENTPDSQQLTLTGDSQTASVVVADDTNLATTITDAASNGVVQKLIVDDVTIGTGAAAKEGDTVEVNYIGTLQNGQEFDNSYKRGKPFTFTVGAGKVIPGWEQGIIGMQTGGQRILVIPANLAYGEAGFGPIPGNATLVFAIELVSIK